MTRDWLTNRLLEVLAVGCFGLMVCFDRGYNLRTIGDTASRVGGAAALACFIIVGFVRVVRNLNTDRSRTSSPDHQPTSVMTDAPFGRSSTEDPRPKATISPLAKYLHWALLISIALLLVLWFSPVDEV